MDKWNPGKVIERTARRLQQAAVQAVRSSSPVSHRATRDVARASFRPATVPGGSLSAAIASKDFVTIKPWGAILNWSKLGQKFLWLVQGTSRQKARPIKLAPDVGELAKELEADAAKHFKRIQQSGQ